MAPAGIVWRVETALAIYEALIQANVPPPAARRVAESLERDMTSNLATKQDLQHFDQLTATRFEALENQMATRFEALENQMATRFEALERHMAARFETVENSTTARFEALESSTSTRFEATDNRLSEFESRIALTMQNMESRIVVKLGVLMTILFGLASAALTLLR